MAWSARLRRLLIGKKLDPLDESTRKHIVLVAFLAWVGLGADGLSSSCYGPEEAFLALGNHDHLALFLAVATAATVFIIALAYNQVIELFPSGGGGYKAATRLIGPHAGLVSGAALMVDYVLTIAISVASGGDALFSLLPPHLQGWKFITEIGMVILLLILNLRGMKESIGLLIPIFLGFVLTHAFLIGYGIAHHSGRIHLLLPDALHDTREMAHNTGWLLVVSLFLRAYSLGGGTYTGIEAVSNNVNMLAEPRVRTGRWTMLYMAVSLAFTAGGIILLYLLWNAHAVPGKTLNAVVFQQIITQFSPTSPHANHIALAVVLALEGGLLLVAANTGFLGGPAVMANMAVDRWVPRQFRQLSSRMVTQNGLLVMGVSALAILAWSGGAVSLLVVLYSINVFLTFSLSLFGLCKHWWKQRRYALHWRRRLLTAAAGLCVTGFILMVTLVEKFAQGGWLTLLVTSFVIVICLLIKRHYDQTQRMLERVDDAYSVKMDWDEALEPPPTDPQAPTAIFFIGANRGAGMYTLNQAIEKFPGRFHNFIFVAVGEVDRQNFDGEGTLANLQLKIENSLHYFTTYCASRGMAAKAYSAFGADPLEELSQLSRHVTEEFPKCVFFAGRLVFGHETFVTRILHNQLPLAMQRLLDRRGQQMVIVPVRIPRERKAEPRDARHIR